MLATTISVYLHHERSSIVTILTYNTNVVVAMILGRVDGIEKNFEFINVCVILEFVDLLGSFIYKFKTITIHI